MGRIVDAIDQMGETDNTLVIYIQGDNGASAEGTPQGLLNEMSIFNGIPEDFKQVMAHMDDLGGPMTFNHYPVGWAHAMDTPFQWTKQVASHFGGTRNGMVISWPARIKDKGGIRTQFSSVIDIYPTILEAVGVQSPSMLNGVPQKPIEGFSMVYTFDNPHAKSVHRTQYFEMFTNRAIYNDGWVAATTPPRLPWVMSLSALPVEDYKWELYNVDQDFSEANDLAAKEPKRLRQLQDLFWAEAGKYNVLPLDNSTTERFDVSLRPSLTRGRMEFTYYPGMIRIPEGTAPDFKNKSYRITADIEIPDDGAEGVLMTQGGRFNGLGLYLLQSKPVFYYNLVGVDRTSVSGNDKLAPGKHSILVTFKYDGGGIGKGGLATLSVDGKKVAEQKLARTIPFRVSADETFDIGEDTGTPVSEDYHVPFKFTGTLNKVVINLGEAALTPQEQKELDQQEGANELID
jgi:arylsulfatase